MHAYGRSFKGQGLREEEFFFYRLSFYDIVFVLFGKVFDVV